VTTTVPMPALTATMSFDEASRIVLDYLTAHVPMGLWAVSRYDGEQQLFLEVADTGYGIASGDAVPWSDTLCTRMTRGDGPQIAPDAMAIPAYAAAPTAQRIEIGAYVGIPIRRGDGDLFGVLCGIDRSAQPSDELESHAPLLALFSSLLTMILEADLARTAQQRAVEQAELAAETDVLTGLLNRRGWERAIALEESRYRRFGDPGSVIVVDLDRLKDINDTLGHAEGDRHIVRAAGALRESLRSYDHLARLAGDEFAVIASGTTPEQTQGVVDRIYAGLAEAGVAGSVGAAPYTIVAGFPGAFARADAAMYAEKQRRRAMAR
jgi:diguanylate cyclase